jgi:hypothetical protein
MWIMIGTRPDLVFTVATLMQLPPDNMNLPSNMSFGTYALNTSSCGITFNGTDAGPPIRFTDSDSLETRRIESPPPDMFLHFAAVQSHGVLGNNHLSLSQQSKPNTSEHRMSQRKLSGSRTTFPPSCGSRALVGLSIHGRQDKGTLELLQRFLLTDTKESTL